MIGGSRNSRVNLFSVELGIPHKTTNINSIHDKMALRFAGLGSVVERSARKAAIAQALGSLAAPLAPEKCVSTPKLSEPAPRRSPN